MSGDGERALPRGWGRFVLERAPRTAAEVPLPRSYASDGQRLTWRAGEHLLETCVVACDVEDQTREPGDEILAWSGAGLGFHRFWVLGEIAAKLLDIPILELVRRHRSGRVPRFPATARVLLLPDWQERYTLGFGCVPGSEARRVRWGGRLPDWGLPRVRTARSRPSPCRDAGGGVTNQGETNWIA